MNVIIIGSRHWTNRETFYSTCSQVVGNASHVFTTKSRGAARLARRWATIHDIPCRVFNAYPIDAMLDYVSKLDNNGERPIVLIFGVNRGTDLDAATCNARGFRIYRVTNDGYVCPVQASSGATYQLEVVK